MSRDAFGGLGDCVGRLLTQVLSQRRSMRQQGARTPRYGAGQHNGQAFGQKGVPPGPGGGAGGAGQVFGLGVGQVVLEQPQQPAALLAVEVGVVIAEVLDLGTVLRGEREGQAWGHDKVSPDRRTVCRAETAERS